MDMHQHFISNYPFLNEADVQAVLDLGVQKEYQEGEEFIRLGEKRKKLGILISGLARAYTIQDSGAEVSIAFIKEGEIACSHDRIFYDSDSKLITEILEPSSILVFDFEDIIKVAESNARIARMKMGISETFLVKVLKRLNTFVTKSPEERYLDLVEHRPDLIQRVQQRHLASFLGITPVSLSRMRARLSKKK